MSTDILQKENFIRNIKKKKSSKTDPHGKFKCVNRWTTVKDPYVNEAMQFLCSYEKGA